MPFKRVWTSDCPKVWAEWKTPGATWVVQDLPPEEDELVVQLLVDNFLVDEKLCSLVDCAGNPEAVEDSRDYWNSALKKRTSLACYQVSGGNKTLAAVNICTVKCVDDDPGSKGKSEPWQQVIGVLDFMEDKVDVFKLLGVDRYLGGSGLFVKNEFRGHGLGSKVLAARESLCRAIGVPATVTVFTGTASQRSAANAGFQHLYTATLADVASTGLRYPADETSILKLMAIKYL